MFATPDHPSTPPQQWPCGPDCIFAKASPGTYGEWMWCNRPAADQRLIRAGRECPYYRAAAYPGECAPPAPRVAAP